MRPALRFAAVALGVVYAGLLVALPPAALFSGDEGIAWLRIESLRRHWWTSLAVDYPGETLDPQRAFLPASLVEAGGTARSTVPGLFVVLASLPRTLLGTRGAYLIAGVAALLCLAASSRLSRLAMEGTETRWTDAAAAASVLATPLLFYGAVLGAESTAAALCLAGMIPLCKAMRDSGSGPAPASAADTPRFGLAAGVLLGLAALARSETILMLPAVVAGGFVAWGAGRFWRAAAATFAGAALVLAPAVLYDRLVLGRWAPLSLPSGSPGDLVRNAIDPVLPAVWRPLAIVFVVAMLAALLLKPRLARLASAPAIVATAVIGFALLLTMGPILTLVIDVTGRAVPAAQRGFGSLAHTMPLVTLLPLIALTPGRPASTGVRFVAWTAGMYMFCGLAILPAAAGPQWGPRSLLPALAPLSIALVAAVAGRRRGPAGRVAAACLVVAVSAGVAMQAYSLRYLVVVRRQNEAIGRRLARAVPEGSVILSDVPLVPQILAPLSPGRQVVYVPPGADVESLDARLADSGAPSFWINRPASGFPWQTPLVPPGARGRAEAMELGAGLVLWPRIGEAEIDSFTRVPRGD